MSFNQKPIRNLNGSSNITGVASLNINEGQTVRHYLKKMYRAKEVAELLGIGLSTVWLYAKQGKLTPIKLSDKVTVFSIDEINKTFNLDGLSL